MDDVPVPPPGDSSGRRPGDRGEDLTALRERAKAGETSLAEYHAAGYRVVGGYAYRNSRSYLDREAFDAMDIVQETMTKATQRYGKFIDRSVKDPSQLVDNVAGVLHAIARNLLADHNPRTGEPAAERPDGEPPRQQRNAVAKKRPIPLDVLWHDGDLGGSFAAPESLAYAAEAILARAREQARRRLHEFTALARGPRACPFHMTSQTGCPNGGRVLALVGEFIDRDIELEGPNAAERLRDLGRRLNLSSKDNDLRRHLIQCFDWWSYQAFSGTVVDQPRAGGDRIRMPLIRWLTAAKKEEAEWDSSVCPKRGAQLILATNPAEFERLLTQLGRADVYEFLKRKAS